MKRILLALLLLPAGLSAADDAVSASRSRIEELERKTAELTAELTAARAEIARLKGEVQARPVVVLAKPLPPTVEKAMEKLPPTRPMTTLSPVARGESVNVVDLLNHYAADPAAADLRYKKREFKLHGVVVDFEKKLISSGYKAIFRVPNSGLKIVCNVGVPTKFTNLYTTHEHEQIVAETSRSNPFVLARVGEEVIIDGRCSGLHDGTITFDYCELLK